MQIEGRKKEGNVSTEGESKNYVKRKGSGKEGKKVCCWKRKVNKRKSVKKERKKERKKEERKDNPEKRRLRKALRKKKGVCKYALERRKWILRKVQIKWVQN